MWRPRSPTQNQECKIALEDANHEGHNTFWESLRGCLDVTLSHFLTKKVTFKQSILTSALIITANVYLTYSGKGSHKWTYVSNVFNAGQGS